jgi:hypothetical protein
VDTRESSAPRPHGCYRGYVYIGYLVEDEDGGEAEIVEAIPCRRCAAESA